MNTLSRMIHRASYASRFSLLASRFSSRLSSTPHKMHIILDFDGTITANDTIGSLAAAAVTFQTKRDASVDWAACWARIVDDYLADHQRHKAAYVPVEAERISLQEELGYLRSLRDVDGGSITAVHNAGLFKGMTPEDLIEAGQAALESANADENVTIRPGFAQFLAQTLNQKQPVSVVSVNWSDAWIRSVVATADTDHDKISIYTNRIADDGKIESNYERAGTSPSPISSCDDKLEALLTAKSTHSIDTPVVYMGDSMTDLECLMHAGEGSRGGGGIVLADGDGPVTSKLLKALARLGYKVPHVSEAGAGLFREVEAAEGDNDATPRLAWARDFDEIMVSRIMD